jgi:hypothetical protein
MAMKPLSEGTSMKIFVNLLVVLVMVVGSRMAMAVSIFDINLSPNSGSITGTIETDGTLGTLGLANVLEYSLILDDGIDMFLINPANSTLYIGGSHGPSQLSATATELLFNFSGTTSNVLFQAFPGGESWEFALQAQPPTANGLIFLTHYAGFFDDHDETEGQIVGSLAIGTVQSVAAVPIPAAAWLFGSALLGLGALKRKRA